MSETTPLEVKVIDGELVIHVGIKTLGYAFKELANAHLDPEDDEAQRVKITDEAVFAREIAATLSDEREDGSTPISDFLDEVCQKAFANGALGAEWDKI